MAGSPTAIRRWCLPRRFLHQLHLWLGVIVGLQLLLWTASGLFMTSAAIETVRGTPLRRNPIPADLRSAGPVLPPEAVLVSRTESAELIMLLGRPVYRLTAGERHWLVDATTGCNRPIDRDDALAIARDRVHLVEPVAASRVFDPPPLELRRPGGAWAVADADGTRVYIATTGEVMAIRTGLWRCFDFAWGLHILDPAGREDSHHPLLIASAALALVSVLSGIALLARRFVPRRR